MRVAAPCQLALHLGMGPAATDRWSGLPEQARGQVLALLARLIARGVIAEDDPAGIGLDGPVVTGGC